MQFQPTPCDGELQAGAVFRGLGLVVEQKRAVDFLNVDPAILDGCSFEREAERRLKGMPGYML
jgi:hypothetical protein